MINFPLQSSIRRRLVFLLLMGSATLAFLLYFVVQSVARQAAQESQDNILAASAVSILDGVKLVDGQTDVDMPYSSLSMLDSVTDERVFYAIYLDANLLTGYPELIKLQTNTAMVPVFSFGTLFDVDVRIVTVKRQIGKNEVFVSVAQTLNGQIKVLRNISSIALGVGFGFFVLSAILAFLIAESTIKPLNRLTLSVSRRGPDELRPVSAPVPSEMVPLVNSLNNFMTRLKLSLQRSEEFIAEAAHRVRTPLAVVRTRTEILLREAKTKKSKAELLEVLNAIDDSSRTAGQLLDHAMVSFRLDNLSEDEIEVQFLIKDVIGRISPLYDLKGIQIKNNSIQNCRVIGDSILLQNALHNVLDNALKYCSENDTITVTVKDISQNCIIEILDSGEGFPENSALLTNRFTRGENTKGIVGSGLGLTIAKDVVEAHGGNITISNTEEGGACVTFTLPCS
ncbi:MAG: sensor histidine kinase [Rhodobacteraceae bacterium]|nr:sensor histidine kinase [Rhodobacterales bacterium]NCX56953.1 sensor histidine kinase [Paracoccaceae bacterium]